MVRSSIKSNWIILKQFFVIFKKILHFCLKKPPKWVQFYKNNNRQDRNDFLKKRNKTNQINDCSKHTKKNWGKKKKKKQQRPQVRTQHVAGHSATLKELSEASHFDSGRRWRRLELCSSRWRPLADVSLSLRGSLLTLHGDYCLSCVRVVLGRNVFVCFICLTLTYTDFSPIFRIIIFMSQYAKNSKQTWN